MPLLTFITPLDQPLGNRRLIEDLRAGLNDPRFTQLSLIVAYAKSGPLLRLQQDLVAWKVAGKHTRAVIGLDQQGTSREAMTLAATLFDELYATQDRGITFHPKLYLFEGPAHATAIIGSNNLTVGGTETNFECATVVELDLPGDAIIHDALKAMWDALMPSVCPATSKVNTAHLQALVTSKALIGEREMQKRSRSQITNRPAVPKSGLALKPASPLPKSVMARNAAAVMGMQPLPAVTATLVGVTGLAIQIRPQGNGEIHLSKTAVLQNSAFFGWPFTGTTVPKKAGNNAYPQRTPDPIVNIEVFGAAGVSLSLSSYALNTVYYTRNSEIRITAAPLVGLVLPYSIMVVTPGTSVGVDYEIAIHRPDSPAYPQWLVVCNQAMPTNQGKLARRFGWF